MAEMQCEFVVALVAAFQDDHHLYLLQEAVMGGEFFTYMQVLSGSALQGFTAWAWSQYINIHRCCSVIT